MFREFIVFFSNQWTINILQHYLCILIFFLFLPPNGKSVRGRSCDLIINLVANMEPFPILMTICDNLFCRFIEFEACKSHEKKLYSSFSRFEEYKFDNSIWNFFLQFAARRDMSYGIYYIDFGLNSITTQMYTRKAEFHVALVTANAQIGMLNVGQMLKRKNCNLDRVRNSSRGQ